MSVPSKYGLLRIWGWVLRVLAVLFLIGCLVLASVVYGWRQWASGSAIEIIPVVGAALLAIIGVVNAVTWIVRASELTLLDDVEQRTRANQQSIDRVMRLTEVQASGPSTLTTQPLPTIGGDLR
jgi:hypothetical protein